MRRGSEADLQLDFDTADEGVLDGARALLVAVGVDMISFFLSFPFPSILSFLFSLDLSISQSFTSQTHGIPPNLDLFLSLNLNLSQSQSLSISTSSPPPHTQGYKPSSAAFREAAWCTRIALLSIFTSELLPSYFSLLVLAGAAFDQAYSQPFSREFEVLGQAEVLGLATIFAYSFAINMGLGTPRWLTDGAVIGSFAVVGLYILWLVAELWYSYREDKSSSLIRQMISSGSSDLSVSLTRAQNEEEEDPEDRY